jgi:DNA-binding GntR family transcriptional regulator
VAAYVRELIISGDAVPGEYLRMDRIADAVGVSNTPVREGLLVLRSEGFVKLVPRRGFMVAPFSRQDLRDLFWFQAQLAGELAARAATRITSEQLHALDESVQLYEAAVMLGDDQRIADLGHSFHRHINLAAGAHRLALILGSAVRHLPNRFYAEIDGQVAATRIDHPALIDALRVGDARRARSTMELHIVERAEHLIHILDARVLRDT